MPITSNLLAGIATLGFIAPGMVALLCVLVASRIGRDS